MSCLSQRALAQAFADFNRLPSPRGAALELLRLVATERASIGEVARVAQTDPVLTGRLIRAANGAAMAAGEPVGTIAAAVLRLGFAATCQIALGFSLVNEYRKGRCEGFDYEGYWTGSLLRGLAARALAARLGTGDPQEALACGLLAEVGRLGLATAKPAAYTELLATCGQRGRRLREAERARFGLDHGSLGAMMLAHWRLPARQIGAVQGYFDLPLDAEGPDRALRRLAWTLALADAVVEAVSAPRNERNAWRRLALEAATRLGAQPPLLEEAAAELAREAAEWGPLLELPAPALEAADFPGYVAATAGGAVAGAPLHVLLVENNESDRLLLRRALARAGHRVREAADGEEALARIAEAPPQVLLTDLDMPRLDGFELCRTLRRSELGSELYVIALTGRERHEDMIEAIRAGVNDFIAKSDTFERLLVRIAAAARLIGSRERAREERSRLLELAADLALCLNARTPGARAP
jgi:HD-like signal output (HDOD) protein/CheY-like chemotaxis protein